ncbi:MAG: SH3 domain-containing protein [Verrucomicrobia bacterium]|nr:SH3 domain-containing protein [Verrucomicrobiota bacterium]
MKKILFTLIALSAAAYAQDVVKVTGDRVSLRAVPDTNAVLLARAMLGDELVLKDNSNPDWVGVLPPASIDLWVNGEFVSNNVVCPEILNIRSGPSLSHSVVGSALKGDKLTVRGGAGGWLKIAPTSNTIVWIKREFTQTPGVAPVEPVTAPLAAAQTQAVVTVVAAPTFQEVMNEGSAISGKPLTEDTAKAQGVDGTYTGVLQPAEGLLYKLIDDHFTDIIVCYVRGNSAQMQTFKGAKIEITGKTYWASGKDLPLVVPARIKPLPVVR